MPKKHKQSVLVGEEEKPAPDRLPSEFDPRNFKKADDPRLLAGPKDAFVGIHFGKPRKKWFVRMRPGQEYRVVASVLVDEDAKSRDESVYVISPQLEMPPELEEVTKEWLLVAAINHKGEPWVYGLSLTESSWSRSGLEAIEKATAEWVALSSVPGASEYITRAPKVARAEPVWPDVPMEKYLRGALRGKRWINSLAHPLVKEYLGES